MAHAHVSERTGVQLLSKEDFAGNPTVNLTSGKIIALFESDPAPFLKLIDEDMQNELHVRCSDQLDGKDACVKFFRPEDPQLPFPTTGTPGGPNIKTEIELATASPTRLHRFVVES